MNKRCILYLRLSDEDQNKLNPDELSESIKNQELMLKDFAAKKGWKITGIYSDEDYSGIDANRPEFNKMLKECEKGKADIVLCKTQSRFTRDMELVEKYLHNKFKEWNVRFVSIIDNADTFNEENKKARQINGLVNEWFLDDTSTNIRKTFKIKREKGQFTGSFAPYGYQKDPENKNHLVIDPIAALTIKKIYDEYLKGYGLNKIANNLNKDNILSPLEYKIMNGSKLQIPLIKNYINYEYIKKTGTYIIDINYFNNEGKILKNLITYNYLTTDKRTFNNKCDIVLKTYSNNKMKIYYTTDKINHKNFHSNNWILLNENECLPKNTTCIATFIKKIDRMNSINYQFEITLKENIKQDIFYFDIIKTIDNEIINLNFNIRIRNKHKWTQQTIKKFLTDEVYIGNLVQFKTTYVSYKNHTIIHNDKDKWIRAYNTHEAIIDKDLWNTIQNRIKEKTRSTKKGICHPFTNKIYCMNCNKVFCKCGKNNKNGYGYLCCKDKYKKWSNCNNNKYLNEEDLHNLIKEKINNLLKHFYDENILNEIQKQEKNNIVFKEKIDNLQEELSIINKKLNNKNSYLGKIYEDRINGIITDDEFIILKTKFNDDSIKLNNRIISIKKEIEETKLKTLKTKKEKIFSEQYKPIENLNIEIIDCLIHKILIGNYNKKANSREIKIIWNFTI